MLFESLEVAMFTLFCDLRALTAKAMELVSTCFVGI